MTTSARTTAACSWFRTPRTASSPGFPTPGSSNNRLTAGAATATATSMTLSPRRVPARRSELFAGVLVYLLVCDESVQQVMTSVVFYLISKLGEKCWTTSTRRYFVAESCCRCFLRIFIALKLFNGAGRTIYVFSFSTKMKILYLLEDMPVHPLIRITYLYNLYFALQR